MRISDWSSDVCSSDLWSNDGSRLTVYCAKVNANNIMGGKTGFKPLTLIIDAVHKKPGTTDLTQKSGPKGSSSSTTTLIQISIWNACDTTQKGRTERSSWSTRLSVDIGRSEEHTSELQ